MVASQRSWSRRADAPVAAVAALVAIIVFSGSWALLHVGFYDSEKIVDTPVYQKYGDWTVDGRVPYRDFRPEYPPLALPTFVAPSLAVGSGADILRYQQAFELVMALCGVAVIGFAAVALAGLGASPLRLAAACGFIALAPLALGNVILSRFDLWPAALTVGAIAALVAGRDRLGSAVLALATAAKIFPAVLVPLAAVWIWRRRGREQAIRAGLVFAVVLALPYLVFLALGPAGVVESVQRQLGRPLQIESLGSAALLTLERLGAVDVEMEASHGSQNVAGLAGDVAGVVMTLLQVAVLVGLWVAYARGPQSAERFVRFAAAALLAFVALGKVLSPQYLVWLIAVVPLVAGRRGITVSALLAAALVLTQLWFPYRYWDWADTLEGGVTWLVLARDLVLVATLAVLAWPARRPLAHEHA